MRSDAMLAFVPLGAPLSLVAGAGISVRSTVLDLLGIGVGVAPTGQGANIIGNATLFGTDMGIGSLRPEINAAIGTAVTTSNAATLNAQLQAAPDLGVGGNYQPGAWQTIAETGPLTAAQLAANTVFMRFPWLPVFPATLRPRYLSLNFSPSAAGIFTAGTVAFALVTIVRDDQANRQATKNFTVG